MLKVIKYLLPRLLKYNLKREEQVTLLTIPNKKNYIVMQLKNYQHY